MVLNCNIVYLLVGQRGAGKTYYARKLLEKYPMLKYVSRDDMLIENFGDKAFISYSGEIEETLDIMYRKIGIEFLTKGVRLVLDCWTEKSSERKNLIAKLKELEADSVVALYFITELESVNTWFWKKDKIAKSSEMRLKRGQDFTFFSDDAPSNDYAVFHGLASGIDFDGFDEIIRVNPNNPVINL